MALSIFKENSIGFCIHNLSPYDTNAKRCDCYKTFIPYTILGKHGIITLCRSWVNYLMLNGMSEEVQDHIRRQIEFYLIELYPALDDSRCSFTRHSCSMIKDSHMTIFQQVCPSPFRLHLKIDASFFLENYCYEGKSTSSIRDFYDKDNYLKGIHNRCEREMNAICYSNVEKLNYFLDAKKRIKKYNVIIDKIINHINKIENENN